MKKISVILALVLALCLCLTGCGEKKKPAEPANAGVANEQGAYESDGEDGELKTPVVDWWKLYKGTDKRNCVTLQVSNPNSEPIGFSYDLVFYKGDEVVKTETNWAMTCIEPGKTGIIYGDIDIPAANEVDKVTIENVEATVFEWTPITGTFTKAGIDNGSQYFDVKFPKAPRHTEIWVVLYNDTNGDKKVQADEFVNMGALAPFIGIYETEGQIHIPVSDEILTYTDYEIYCLAFAMDS